jgi:hypothetical protein
MSGTWFEKLRAAFDAMAEASPEPSIVAWHETEEDAAAFRQELEDMTGVSWTMEDAVLPPGVELVGPVNEEHSTSDTETASE